MTRTRRPLRETSVNAPAKRKRHNPKEGEASMNRPKKQPSNRLLPGRIFVPNGAVMGACQPEDCIDTYPIVLTHNLLANRVVQVPRNPRNNKTIWIPQCAPSWSKCYAGLHWFDTSCAVCHDQRRSYLRKVPDWPHVVSKGGIDRCLWLADQLNRRCPSNWLALPDHDRVKVEIQAVTEVLENEIIAFDMFFRLHRIQPMKLWHRIEGLSLLLQEDGSRLSIALRGSTRALAVFKLLGNALIASVEYFLEDGVFPSRSRIKNLPAVYTNCVESASTLKLRWSRILGAEVCAATDPIYIATVFDHSPKPLPTIDPAQLLDQRAIWGRAAWNGNLLEYIQKFAGGSEQEIDPISHIGGDYFDYRRRERVGQLTVSPSMKDPSSETFRNR